VVSDANEVRARAAAWQAAIEARDVELVRDLMHQDYALVLVVPTAVTVKREEWLRVLPNYLVHRYEIHEQVVHTSEGTAAVLTLATQHATVHGQDRSDRFVLSDTWMRGEDRAWRVWRRHSTPATGMALPRGSGAKEGTCEGPQAAASRR
jgi:ketosteroid isomerase-like protein